MQRARSLPRRERDGVHANVPSSAACGIGSKDRDAFRLRFKRFYQCAAFGEYVRVKPVIRADVGDVITAMDRRRHDGQLALE